MGGIWAACQGLPVPLGVSGLRPGRLEAFAERLAGSGARLLAYRASAVPGRAGDPTQMVPGATSPPR